jgi:hypothetical protein
MLNSGQNGKVPEKTTLPTEANKPTNEPTQEEVTEMELVVLNSLLAKYQSRKLISISHRLLNGKQTYSINFPVGTWEMERGKFQLNEPTSQQVSQQTSQQAEITV